MQNKSCPLQPIKFMSVGYFTQANPESEIPNTKCNTCMYWISQVCTHPRLNSGSMDKFIELRKDALGLASDIEVDNATYLAEQRVKSAIVLDGYSTWVKELNLKCDVVKGEYLDFIKDGLQDSLILKVRPYLKIGKVSLLAMLYASNWDAYYDSKKLADTGQEYDFSIVSGVKVSTLTQIRKYLIPI